MSLIKLNNNAANFFICLVILFIYGCSPKTRFERILQKHPELFEKTFKDSVIIKSGQVYDTTFYSSKIDTLVFRDVTIYKQDSIITVFYKTAPCTTYVKSIVYQPKETVIKEVTKEQKRSEFFYRLIIFFFVAGTLISALSKILK